MQQGDQLHCRPPRSPGIFRSSSSDSRARGRRWACWGRGQRAAGSRSGCWNSPSPRLGVRTESSGQVDSAQPSPAQPWGQRARESADKKRGGHPLSARGPAAGLHAAVVCPAVPGGSGGSWTPPSEVPGVAGQPSLSRSTLCLLRDRDVWGRSPGATLVPPLQHPDAWPVSAPRRSPQASRLGEVKSHWRTPT